MSPCSIKVRLTVCYELRMLSSDIDDHEVTAGKNAVTVASVLTL